MSVAGKHSEFGDPGNSFSAAAFRKALKGFEIGNLPYSEVQFELKRLLTGVSRRELREVLRRSESIEPLPEYAYREVRRFLDETIEQDMAPQTDPGGVREQQRRTYSDLPAGQCSVGDRSAERASATYLRAARATENRCRRSGGRHRS